MLKISNWWYKKDAPLIYKAHKIIIVLIRISLFVAIIGSIYTLRWTILFVSALTFFLTFLPNFFEKKYKVNIPVEFEIITVLFIYSSLFLGEVHGYYTRFWWWDVILHIGSAIALGFIGFTILYVLYKGNKINASPLTIAIFSFFFAVGIGAIWEIYEFGMDQIFGYNMQKSGLVDTMWDLIVDSVGALIAAVSGYFYLKKDEAFIFKRIIKKFEKENPGFFTNKDDKKD
jgi:hypothetical protein